MFGRFQIYCKEVTSIKEIYISDYFQNIDQNSYSGRDWKRVNAIRNKINNFEWQKDIYNYLYDRRLNFRDEDERFFGIPRDAVITLHMHPNVKNRWYSPDHKDEKVHKDYFKRKNGKIIYDKYGNPKEYGKVGQSLLNAADNLEYTSMKIVKLVRFIIMHPILSLAIVLTPIIIALLFWLMLWVTGSIGSLGHTPFVLCGDDKIYGNQTVIVGDANLDEMAKKEYAANIFIHKADEAGWTSNAIIGCLAYILRESGGMGTFSYEGYTVVTGPGDVTLDKTLDNQSWLDWLEESGKYQLHDIYYHNAHGSGHVCFEEGYRRFAAVGLGLLQDSNVWSYRPVWVDGHLVEDPYLVTDNANKLIQWCEDKGRPWQDPETQVEWVLYRFSTAEAWDGDNANPILDNRTAEEWCRRACTGVGMPGWRYNTTNPGQNREINYHINFV